MSIIKMKLNTEMLVACHGSYRLQVYWPIISYRENILKLSFSTVLVVGGPTWQFDWSVGFQVLGFGFGVGKHRDLK